MRKTMRMKDGKGMREQALQIPSLMESVVLTGWRS